MNVRMMDRGQKMVYLARKKNNSKTLNISLLGKMKPGEYVYRWMKKYYDESTHGVDDDKEDIEDNLFQRLERILWSLAGLYNLMAFVQNTL